MPPQDSDNEHFAVIQESLFNMYLNPHVFRPQTPCILQTVYPSTPVCLSVCPQSVRVLPEPEAEDGSGGREASHWCVHLLPNY